MWLRLYQDLAGKVPRGRRQPLCVEINGYDRSLVGVTRMGRVMAAAASFWWSALTATTSSTGA